MPADQFTPEEELAAARKAVPEEFSDEAEWYIASLREKGLIEEPEDHAHVTEGLPVDTREDSSVRTDPATEREYQRLTHPEIDPPQPWPEFVILQDRSFAPVVDVAEIVSEDGVRPVVYEYLAKNLKRERAEDFVRSLDSHA